MLLSRLESYENGLNHKLATAAGRKLRRGAREVESVLPELMTRRPTKNAFLTTTATSSPQMRVDGQPDPSCRLSSILP